MLIHNKQYILDTKQHLITKDWKSLNLCNGHVLSYSKRLRVICNQKRDVVLLGDAWSIEDDGISPEAMIENISVQSSTEDLCRLDEKWCGRYLLIVGNKILLDAQGSLGAFYTDNGVVSSSVSILKEICEPPCIQAIPKINVVHDGIIFWAGQDMPFEGMHRLLPSQVMDYTQGTTEVRPLYYPIDNLSDVERMNQFVKYMQSSLLNMRNILRAKIYGWL